MFERCCDECEIANREKKDEENKSSAINQNFMDSQTDQPKKTNPNSQTQNLFGMNTRGQPEGGAKPSGSTNSLFGSFVIGSQAGRNPFASNNNPFKKQ